MLPARQSTHRSSPEWSSLSSLGIVAAALVALYFARPIVIPFAFALAFGFVLTPPTSWLQRLKIGRVPSVVIVMTVAVASLAAIGWLVANQLIEVAANLPAYKQNIHNKIQRIQAPATGTLGRIEQSISEIGSELSAKPAPLPTISSPLPVEVVTPEPAPVIYLRDLAQPFLVPLALAGFVLILTVFILIHREDLRNRLLRLVGVSQLHATTQAIDDASQRISRYLILQVLVNGLVGVVIAVGLSIIGVPYPALWGALTALLRMIPYAGILCAAAMPLLLSLAVFEGWVRPALVVALYFTLEVIVSNFIEPWLYGTNTGISSLGLLVSAVFWTLLWGLPGLILSTPLTVCVAVLGRHVPQLAFLHIALGDQDILSTEIQLYQRLLAMDHAEARAVIDQFLKDRPLLDLYDQVIVPALILAEQERHRATLEPAREEFIFLSISEMVAELAAQEEEEAEPAKSKHPGRVLLIPAKDTADEISAALFSQLLEHAGCAVVSLPAGSSEELALLHPDSAEDLICISALPPFALSAAAKLGTHLRARFPNARIMAGIWGFPEGREKVLRKMETSGHITVATTLAQALDLVLQTHPLELPV